MPFTKKIIALESRLRKCRNVETLGVKPNFSDYPEADCKRILNAHILYYPSTFYAGLFQTAGKKIFPSYNTYHYVQDKMKQTALFKISGIRHPETRFFYGKKQKKSILNYFKYPFIGKIPRGSSRGEGVFLIKNQQELLSYLDRTNVAYIQKYMETDRDIRVVVIGNKVAHAYYRIACEGEFRTNLSKGGTVNLSGIPEEALDLALTISKKFNWNDFGIDILLHKGEYFALEANMKYGREGFKEAGINFYTLMENMIENGEI